ncbi:MAG: ArsR family transcriptional regulator [Bacteroidetes bacterium]|nr:ArsR family transcriptional regulator [Bacteroidota bacterium]
MLDTLITSKTRVKLLLKFFLNSETKAYLRGLEEELGENSNAIRLELNRLSKAGLLESATEGRQKFYHANKNHPLFPELHSVVRKYLGIDQVIESVLKNLGDIEFAFVTGDYAKGKDSGIIDLTLVGSVNKDYLNHLVEKTETLIKRKVRTLVLSVNEFDQLTGTLQMDKAIVVWKKE